MSIRVLKKNRWWSGLALVVALLLVACGSNDTTGIQSTAGPAAVRVNGFGVAANHVHSLLALPPHVLIMATHYGIFRSADDGASWQEVAGGTNQLMQGLMAYSLGYSSLDSQRLYVLTQPAVNQYAGTPGLYTSADQGRTWELSIATASLTSHTIFLAAPGNDTSGEVYIYLPDLGPLGLRVSVDAGKHFSSTGMLPFGRINGLLAIPGMMGHLLAYGSDGMAYSADGGIHWQSIKGITGGIFDVATAGPSTSHLVIYASGDAGIFVSPDGGRTFTLVDSQDSFNSLSVSAAKSQILYGKSGTGVYRSINGGQMWSLLPHIKGNLAVLAVDPNNAMQVYLSLSYPTAIYRLDGKSKEWMSLTPQP